MNILTIIEERRPDFTASDRSIADFVQSNTEEALLLSASSIGQRTKTSASAVIRFIKKLEIPSLVVFRSELSKATFEKKGDDSKPDMIVRKDDRLETIAQKLRSLSVDSINKAVQLISNDNFRQAVDKLCSAETIYLYGIGASGIVAEDLYRKLIRINKRVVFNLDSHTQLLTASNTTSKDAVIAFSFSGETAEIIKAVEFASHNGSYCIGVTKASKSPLSELCDCVCAVPAVEKKLRIGAISSRYGQLIISDILYVSILQNNYDKHEQSLIKSKKILSSLRNQ